MVFPILWFYAYQAREKKQSSNLRSTLEVDCEYKCNEDRVASLVMGKGLLKEFEFKTLSFKFSTEKERGQKYDKKCIPLCQNSQNTYLNNVNCVIITNIK